MEGGVSRPRLGPCPYSTVNRPCYFYPPRSLLRHLLLFRISSCAARGPARRIRARRRRSTRRIVIRACARHSRPGRTAVLSRRIRRRPTAARIARSRLRLGVLCRRAAGAHAGIAPFATSRSERQRCTRRHHQNNRSFRFHPHTLAAPPPRSYGDASGSLCPECPGLLFSASRARSSADPPTAHRTVDRLR